MITQTAEARTSEFSWTDHRTIAHALGGLDGKEYLNSREGFLAMYNQGVRLFELDLSRTSDGVWVCRHNWNESMGQWKGTGKKVLTEKQLENSTFLRCHQSFIVNMERITGAKTESFSIGENVIPISRSYNKTAHERYEEYLQLQQEISWGGVSE